MKYILYFDFAAFIITLVLLVLACLRKNLESKRFNLYKLVLLSHLVAIIFDIVSSTMMSFPEKFSLFQNYFFIAGYLIIHNLTGLLYIFYGLACEKIDDSNSNIKRSWLYVFLIELLLLITSPFTKFIYYFDSNLVYQHGFGIYLIYLIGYCEAFYVLYIKIQNIKNISTFELISNIAYVVALLISFILNFVIPSVLMELFAFSVGFLVMFIAHDNSEQYLYKGIAVFNRNAFDEKLYDRISSKKDFSILVFSLKDAESYMYDNKQLFIEEKNILSKFKEKNDIRKRLFVLDKLTYAVLCKMDEENYYIDSVNSLFNANVDGSLFSFGVLRIPSVTNNYQMANIILDDLIVKISSNYGDDLIIADNENTEKYEDKQIEKFVRRAIKDNDVVIKYEPIFSLKTNYTFDAETRIFIKGDNDSLIPFDDFSPIALANGEMYKIDQIVLQKVSEFIKKAKIKNLGINNIYIHLSLKKLSRSTFIDEITDFTRISDISDNKISFMLTNLNRGIISDAIINNINKAKELGFGFVLNDFGTDKVNIMNLCKLSLNSVKISSKLVNEAKINNNAKKVFKNIVKMIKDLNLEPICSKVNSLKDAEFVSMNGVDLVKGSYYCEALDSDEYILFMQDQIKLIFSNISNN